ncbi:MAG: hypothetical protein HFJ48_05215 [Clostridia bacterium]|nr:hypothetical protein [Clostridia bacterium]
MKSEEVIKILNNIKEMIEKQEYEKALTYITKQKVSLAVSENRESNYIDDLVRELK